MIFPTFARRGRGVVKRGRKSELWVVVHYLWHLPRPSRPLSLTNYRAANYCRLLRFALGVRLRLLVQPAGLNLHHPSSTLLSMLMPGYSVSTQGPTNPAIALPV